MLRNYTYKLLVLQMSLLVSACSHMENIPKSPLLSNWKSLRDQNIVMQKYDYSCGPASLATLLTYHYDDQVDELTLLKSARQVLSKKAYKVAQKEGLSLFDLKLLAEKRGYLVKGVKIPLSSLQKIPIPVLVHLNIGRYQHFAVLKGVKNNRVYLADPSRGNLEMSPTQFSEEWRGVALLIFHPKNRPIKGLNDVERLEASMMNRQQLY
jgi:uncharacterized protein